MQFKYWIVMQDGTVVGTNDLLVVSAWAEQEEAVAAISTDGSGSFIDEEGNFKPIAETTGPDDGSDYEEEEEEEDSEDEEEEEEEDDEQYDPE